MEKKPDRRGLGRGLSALMSEIDPGTAGSAPRAAEMTVPIEKIAPNPNQPRRDFNPIALKDLAASILRKGVLQPLIVRPRRGDGEEYEIIAGERRWRAAQQVGVHRVPVIVRDMDDAEVIEVAIIENIQRADLNAIEEAQGYRQLMERFGHTQEKIAEALSRSRSHIANLLRLLTLPGEVQNMVRSGKLTAGHARALVSCDDPLRIALLAVNRGLSVREVERLVAEERKPRTTRRPPREPKDADTRAIELDLSAGLQLPVSINHTIDGNGTLTITYNNLEDLDMLCRALSIARRDDIRD